MCVCAWVCKRSFESYYLAESPSFSFSPSLPPFHHHHPYHPHKSFISHYFSSVQSLGRLGPHGLTFTWWGCCSLCLWHKLTELAHSFLFCSCVYFCLYDPFKCISFHKFSRQLSAYSLCSSCLSSAVLVLSTVYLFMKVILCGCLGSKPKLTSLTDWVVVGT